MRFYLSKDEWWPVYEVFSEPTVYDNVGIELSEEEIRDYEKWQSLNEKVQTVLSHKWYMLGGQNE